MSNLNELWEVDRFRAAIRDLLSLSPSDLATLRSLTEETFNPPAKPIFEFDAARSALVIAAANTLYEEQRENPDEDLVAELRSLVDRSASEFGDVEIAEAALRNLIERRPSLEKRERISAVEHFALPNLERFGLFLDVRVSQHEGELLHVPVLLARLSFDEPVLGAAAVSFQLTQADLGQIRNELDQISALIARWQDESGRDEDD